MSSTYSRLASSSLVGVLLASCVPNPDEAVLRYEGGVRPCEVEVASPSGERPQLEPMDRQPLWYDGPFDVWNTHPASRCNRNPTINTDNPDWAAVDGSELYITYPTTTAGSVTGVAEAAAGRFPLIVFAHANNDTKCEIYEDYWSLHDHWASWGFVVVSVDGTRFNCTKGTTLNIRQRQDGQLAAIEAVERLDEDPDSFLHGRIDTDRIIFAGHSRGGGSSLIAAHEHDNAVGAIALQSIHLGAFGIRNAPLRSVPGLGITAGLDVDLNYPRVEVVEDQFSGSYSWVNINGGIHAYTADRVPLEFDDRPGITRGQQHDLTELYTTAFLLSVAALPMHASMLQPAHEALYTPIGQQLAVDSISEAGVYQRWRTPYETLLVDDFDSEVTDEQVDVNVLGLDNDAEGFVTAEERSTYRPWGDVAFRYKYSRSLLLHALRPGIFTMNVGDLDVRHTPLLGMHIKRPQNGLLALEAKVEVVAREGSVTFDLYRHAGPIAVDDRFQQVLIDLRDTDLDLASVDAVKLHVGGGMLQVDNVAFAASDPPAGTELR